MMKVALVAILLAVGLSGCVTASNGSQAGNILAMVQQRTKQACGYLPPAQMVYAVSGKQDGNIDTALVTAQNICALNG